jgi:hypothetical protein
MLTSRGLPEAATAIAIAAQLGLARALLRADETCVYAWGLPWRAACAARVRFGVPCPTCGATRSFVLALHGHFGSAWHLFPAGPLVVGGLVAVATVCASLAWLARRGAFARAEAYRRTALALGAVYGGGVAVTWITDWIMRCHRA